MELFVSEPTKPLDVALRELELSDAVILVIGFMAGSLIPENVDLTYTAAEFRRAQELGRPTFAFFQTEGGSWINKETTPSLRDALDDQLKLQVLLAVEKWNAEGRPGARMTFTTPEEFFAPYERAGVPRLFDFDQTLRGRAPEIDALNAFLMHPHEIVALLSGRGGIGKSKLLREWCRAIGTAKVIYVRDDAVWHAEAAKEVPFGNVLIVADDAHRIEFLNELLTLVRRLRQHQNVKLVLSARPSGASQIDAALATRFEPAELRRLQRLERLTVQSVTALAQETLGPAHAQHALALARVSADTPLVTVVGGRLIARGAIEPALLANEEEFRHQVFDRFSAEYEQLLPEGPVNWRALLNLIATLSPLRPNTDEFLTPAAAILHCRADEIVSAIDILERHGLLLRGGNLVRIVPDVLSDYLLEGACIARAGHLTGFADVVFEHYRGTHVSNILRNLAELDWRVAQRGPAPQLLHRIWETLNNAFETGDAAVRVEILKSLEQAALFQPTRVGRLIRQAMETEARPTTLYGDWEVNQDDVLRALPPLLNAMAHHADHLEYAVRTLWALTRRDARPRNRYPMHAARVLEDLAAYGRYKPVLLNDLMADMATELSREVTSFDRSFTPLDLADKLLAREGEFLESDGIAMTLGGFALNYPVIKPVREKAIALVRSCVFSDNARIASRAVKSLSEILQGFLPAFARGVSPEEHAWQDGERLAALEIIEARLRRPPLPVPLVRQIWAMLRQLRPRGRDDAVGQRFSAVLASVPQSDDLLMFDAFCTGTWELDGGAASIEEGERQHQELIRRGVQAFQRRHVTAHQQVDALARMAEDAESSGIDISGKAVSFIEESCSDARFLSALVPYLLNQPHPSLGHMIYVPLRILRSTAAAAYESAGTQAASHQNPVTRTARPTRSASARASTIRSPLICRYLQGSRNTRIKGSAI
jgi:hypothetical protein